MVTGIKKQMPIELIFKQKPDWFVSPISHLIKTGFYDHEEIWKVFTFKYLNKIPLKLFLKESDFPNTWINLVQTHIHHLNHFCMV